MHSFRSSSPISLRRLASIHGRHRRIPRSRYASSSNVSQAQYQQIPEHLKIHMFTDELRIIKEDELKGSFKKFSPGFIVNLLDMRADEVRLEKENSNPSSRMTLANITRIMKLTSRLKQLFDINGGNTEVLDAVISSQSQLEKLELKLAAKRAASENSANEPVSQEVSKPQYLQIPDDIKIHEFVDHLKDVQLSEIKAPFASVNAAVVMDAVERRIKKYQDDPNFSKDTLSSYLILRSRLKRLFDVNGSYTFILDTVINSQRTFDNFEQRLRSRRLEKPNEAPEYKQIPDDFSLEEFSEELELVRAKLVSDFTSSTSQDIIQATRSLIEKEISDTRRIALEKLLHNLTALFRHNNNETFILDNVLLSSSIFRACEDKIEDKKYAELFEGKTEATKYHEGEKILPLLESQNSFFDEGFLEQDLKIKTAVLEAMSKEEKELSNSDPDEYKRLQNLTPESIRESYTKRFEVPSSPLEKAKVENYLKETKRNKDSLDEMRWREREAYEWSSNIYLKNRSLEARNFFNPIFMDKSAYSFPMFPGKEKNSEYLILFTNGQQITSSQNPLGLSHVPENMLKIIEKIPESELPTVLESLCRLKKQHWRLVGSTKNGSMLVLSRNKRRRLSLFFTFLKSALFATGVVLVLSIMDARRRVKENPDSQINAISHASEEWKSQKDDQEVHKPFWRTLFWSS